MQSEIQCASWGFQFGGHGANTRSLSNTGSETEYMKHSTSNRHRESSSRGSFVKLRLMIAAERTDRTDGCKLPWWQSVQRCERDVLCLSAVCGSFLSCVCEFMPVCVRWSVHLQHQSASSSSTEVYLGSAREGSHVCTGGVNPRPLTSAQTKP